MLDPVPTAPRPGLTAILPVNHWRNENNFTESVAVRKPYQFISPDRTTFIPAGQDFVTGELYYGSKLHDVLRAFGMAPVLAGQAFYVSDESEEKTYQAQVGDDGTISTLKLFAEQGGESVAADTEGDVYIAAGQIFVYDPAGHRIEYYRSAGATFAVAVWRQGRTRALHPHSSFFVFDRDTDKRAMNPVSRASRNVFTGFAAFPRVC